MQAAIDAYSVAAGYGVAGITTASTYRIGEIYNDFSKALMTSQRPKGLNADELEQYNVLLEEQAFPFEERAIEIHEANAKRAAEGIYDQWVRRSFAALGKLRPVQYAKAEKSEAVIRAIR
jgi:cellulose synthase operon protein C